MTITETLLKAAKAGKFQFCTQSKEIPGKWVFFFDYEQCGDLTGDGCRSAALYEYESGAHESNQFSNQVHESYYDRLSARDF